MTERLHFSLSCIGEGNGDPLQCSFLENPRDGEPGGLPSMGLHRVGHDLSDLAAAAAYYLASMCLCFLDFFLVVFQFHSFAARKDAQHCTLLDTCKRHHNEISPHISQNAAAAAAESLQQCPTL